MSEWNAEKQRKDDDDFKTFLWFCLGVGVIFTAVEYVVGKHPSYWFLPISILMMSLMGLMVGFAFALWQMVKDAEPIVRGLVAAVCFAVSIGIVVKYVGGDVHAFSEWVMGSDDCYTEWDGRSNSSVCE